MENVQFPVSSTDFLNAVVSQSGNLSLGELVTSFSQMAGGVSPKKESKMRCSLKTGGSGVVFSVGKSDLVVSLGILGGFVGREKRVKFCKRLAKAITDHRDFAKDQTEVFSSQDSELSFPLEVASGELTGIKFDKLDKKTLVNLKKKVLESMLGVGAKAGDKGRPIGANLRCGETGLYIEMSHEQGVALLKRTLAKLSAEQLISLDSRLGGAITSFPDDKGL